MCFQCEDKFGNQDVGIGSGEHAEAVSRQSVHLLEQAPALMMWSWLLGMYQRGQSSQERILGVET